MPRKPRESSGTGIYHVMLRGINRQDIFEDAEDYYTFIRMMAMVANQGNQGDRSDSFGMSDHGPVPVISEACPHDSKLRDNNMPSLKISPIIWRIGK